MNHGLNIRPTGALDLLSLGALVHRLDPGIIPFRKATERFHRLDNDTLEWSETINDPKIYTRPWDTMKLRMTLQDSRIDLMTRYCSPVEIDNYNKTFGDAAGAN